MNKHFHPKTIESKWYRCWEQQGYFAPSGHGKPYCIMLPPPNVTGSLHMGHGFQQTLMDVLIRYHRMCGDNTLWQAGTDHAGIATQMVVERQLEASGSSRKKLGRERFIEKIWQWQRQSGGRICEQMRRLGSSIDWQRERFTMEPTLSKAVNEVFVRLFAEGLIYRGQRLVNWDPVLRTALSDLEVISEEEQGSLWHIRYPLADGSTAVIVATTRPETLLGDTAVAVNPSDTRYQQLIGKTIKLPLTEREIPVIADDYVDKDFGSGCVKITPAHDFNDYAMAQRHDLPLINILNQDGTLNDNVPSAYQGLDRFQAREQVLNDLQAQGLLVKTVEHTLKVPRGDRSNTVVEPYLTEQWYVDAKTLAQPAIEAVTSGAIEFIPKQYENMYFAWMRDIQDWCISRQLWWGHQIPAWYDKDGNVYVGRSELEVREKYQLGNKSLTRDEDVLDTWFSSALWTFVTLGWPEKTAELRTFHPTNVLVTGFDIIFFWVARMIMMTLHFTGEIPFKQVYIHGLVRDSAGKKMSKSKGNIIDPIDLIDGIGLDDLLKKRCHHLMQPAQAESIAAATRKEFPDGIPAYGTDALRYTYCSLAATGRDIQFDMGRIEGYRHFCNKIWNAARYVLSHTEGYDCDCHAGDISLADRWIVSRLQHTIRSVTDALQRYRFDQASQQLYEFIWNEYCDWYLELSKPVLWQASEHHKQATRYVLLHVLETTLRLLHPFMPYITEEIWQRVAPLLMRDGDTIMLQPYPTADDKAIDQTVEDDISWLQAIILAIRTIRSDMTIPPGQAMPVLLRSSNTINDADRQRLTDNRTYLIKLAKLESIDWLEGTPPPSASALAGQIEVLVPMAGLIDQAAEIERLERVIDKQQAVLDKLTSKLGNKQFVDKAPSAVVAKEREKAQDVEQALAKLKQQLASIRQAQET